MFLFRLWKEWSSSVCSLVATWFGAGGVRNIWIEAVAPSCLLRLFPSAASITHVSGLTRPASYTQSLAVSCDTRPPHHRQKYHTNHIRYYHNSNMIRRNPTLIPMSDMDVQDIRNLIAQKKAAEAAEVADAASILMAAKGKGKDTSAAPAAGSAAAAGAAQGGQGYAAAEDAKRKREGMSRDERLGL